MATTYALIANGVVVELIVPAYDSSGNEIPISSRFTQDFLQSLVPVVGQVAVGYTYANGVFTAPVGPSTVTALQAAKALQITVISEACQDSIFSGFTSSALGAVYSYPAKSTDQLNLLSSVESALLAAKLALPWSPAMVFAVDDTVLENGVIYRAASAGLTGQVKPVFPTALGQLVLDNLVYWDVWATPFWCADSAGNWAWRYHTSWEMMRVGMDGKRQVLSKMLRNQQLAAMVSNCTTVAQVKAITWDTTVPLTTAILPGGIISGIS
jgi:hypothetical protein